MKPSEKSIQIEEFLDNILPNPRRKSIIEGTCSWCGKSVNGFRDRLSEKEYTISGFCQECQDKTFG
uniref:Uncharacterized protein n=1 Tax=viral metagenome TaxID=1070528 RepID=A0A6H1ZDN1_9ZZZZ